MFWGSNHSPARRGGEPDDDLQVQRAQQRGPRHYDPGEYHDPEGGAEGAVGEQAQVQQRVGEPALPPHEHDAEEGPDRDGHYGHDIPAVPGQLLEAVDRRKDRGQRQRNASQVEAARALVPVLGEEHRSHRQKQGHERDAEQER
jgi:hypothetical protein